jgi:hypothetical protein
MQRKIERAFRGARGGIALAVDDLKDLIREYMSSNLSNEVKKSRIAALDAKIDYLLGLPLNHASYPWSEDVVDTEV